MAEQKGSGGGGAAVVVVLAICAAAGMASGPVVGASSRHRSTATGQSEIVTVTNDTTFDGSLAVSTSACEKVDADQLRYDATDSVGSSVASITQTVDAGRTRQAARLGRGLPEGRYTVTVTCLSQGQPVGDFRTATFRVRPERGARTGATPSGSALPMPHTGS